MFWIVLPVLLSCSVPFVSYFIRSKQFLKSSASFLRHLDPAFIEWTYQLIHDGFLDEKLWILRYPSYLYGCCCPRVKSMSHDSALLAQLTDMTPAHAFGYTLARKLAEACVQFSACWIPICLVAAAVYVCKKWTFEKNESVKISKDSNQSFCSLKRTYAVLSLVPLSILLPCLAELAFGGVLDYQKRLIGGSDGNMLGSSYFSLVTLRIKDMMSEGEPPSFFHLFNGFRLHRILYGDMTLSQDAATILCQQTKLSLSYWSVLSFVGSVYAVIALALRALFWRPIKMLYNLITKNKLQNSKQGNKPQQLPILTRALFWRPMEKLYNLMTKNKLPNSKQENKPQQLSEKFSKRFDAATCTDHLSLFSDKESQTSSATTASRRIKKRQQRPSTIPESGDGSSRGYGSGMAGASDPQRAVRPRYVSRGTLANLD